jgi:hypothetical protein
MVPARQSRIQQQLAHDCADLAIIDHIRIGALGSRNVRRERLRVMDAPAPSEVLETSSAVGHTPDCVTASGRRQVLTQAVAY